MSTHSQSKSQSQSNSKTHSRSSSINQQQHNEINNINNNNTNSPNYGSTAPITGTVSASIPSFKLKLPTLEIQSPNTAPIETPIIDDSMQNINLTNNKEIRPIPINRKLGLSIDNDAESLESTITVQSMNYNQSTPLTNDRDRYSTEPISIMNKPILTLNLSSLINNNSSITSATNPIINTIISNSGSGSGSGFTPKRGSHNRSNTETLLFNKPRGLSLPALICPSPDSPIRSYSAEANNNNSTANGGTITINSSHSNSIAPPAADSAYSKSKKLAYYAQQCTEIIEYLYVAGQKIASNLEILTEYNIRDIVNCAGDVCDNSFENEGLNYLRFYLLDSASEDIMCILYPAFEFIDSARSAGRSVLIHCQQGVSRSTIICIAYLMYVNNADYEPMYRLVRDRRGVCRPNVGFMCQLLAWRKRITGTSSRPFCLYRLAPHCSRDSTIVAKWVDRVDSTVLDERAVFILQTPNRMFIWIGASVSPIQSDYLLPIAQQQVRRLQQYEHAPLSVSILYQLEERLTMDKPTPESLAAAELAAVTAAALATQQQQQQLSQYLNTNNKNSNSKSASPDTSTPNTPRTPAIDPIEIDSDYSAPPDDAPPSIHFWHILGGNPHSHFIQHSYDSDYSAPYAILAATAPTANRLGSPLPNQLNLTQFTSAPVQSNNSNNNNNHSHTANSNSITSIKDLSNNSKSRGSGSGSGSGSNSNSIPNRRSVSHNPTHNQSIGVAKISIREEDENENNNTENNTRSVSAAATDTNATDAAIASAFAQSDSIVIDSNLMDFSIDNNDLVLAENAYVRLRSRTRSTEFPIERTGLTDRELKLAAAVTKRNSHTASTVNNSNNNTVIIVNSLADSTDSMNNNKLSNTAPNSIDNNMEFNNNNNSINSNSAPIDRTPDLDQLTDR